MSKLGKLILVLSHIQSTEIGLSGMIGATVLSRVEVECRKDQDLVPIPRHNSKESHAPGRAWKRDRAMKTLAQVNCCFCYC